MFTMKVFGRQSDAHLVRRVLQNHPKAFEALVLRHQRRGFAVAMGMGLALEAAEDVLQEGLLRSFRELPRLRDAESFGPWFLSIVRNAALMMNWPRTELRQIDRLPW